MTHPARSATPRATCRAADQAVAAEAGRELDAGEGLPPCRPPREPPEDTTRRPGTRGPPEPPPPEEVPMAPGEAAGGKGVRGKGA